MVIRNKTANLYTEWKPLINGLSNEEAGIILKNILNYQSGEDINNTNPVWIFIKAKLDEYNNKLIQISEKRKENGKLGGLAKATKCYQMLASDSKCSNKIKENKIKEKEYKYKGTIIKLNDKDYEDWKNKYNLLDLDYELGQMDLSLQTEKYKTKQKDWFFMVQGWLNKLQKEKEKNKSDGWRGLFGDGVPTHLLDGEV